MAQALTIDLFPCSNYTIVQKEPQLEKDPTLIQRFARQESLFEAEGLRRTVEVPARALCGIGCPFPLL